jgi:sugar lactone lactonase YvrE
MDGCNDLTALANGSLYFTDPPAKKVWQVDAQGNRRAVVESGLEFPNGVTTSPDQSLLMVADSRSRWIWSYQIQPDGSLANGQKFYHLEASDDSGWASADGLKTDSEGFLYAATNSGVQICDQPGRVTAILSKPQAGPLSNVLIAGPYLYVTAGDKVYRRAIKRTAALPWQPVKPPQPRL